MDKELDELISRYTEDLMSLRQKWSELGFTTEDKSKPEPEPLDAEGNVEPDPPEEDSNNYMENFPDTAVKPDEEKENLSPETELPLAEPENFALFTARVYSGNQAYAVPNAKISIYLDGKLHAFLITDENGATRQIKLQSYPGKNNFIPDSTQQTLDYSADIFAEGFAERKNLLVSAVGGSEILLSTELTPLSERID
jgi:hypothetical protein